jgi:hypothetical protein
LEERAFISGMKTDLVIDIGGKGLHKGDEDPVG